MEDNLEQESNMYSIFVTEIVLKLDKFKLIKEEQCEKKYFILIAEEVSNESRINVLNELQSENICSNVLVKFVLKFDKSILFKYLHP